MGETALATESITAYYDGRATGNQEKAQLTCEAWAQTYPREFLLHSFLSGFIYPVPGGFEKAAEEARKNIELAPDNGVGYFNLGYDSVYLDRLGEAENAARAASERKIESPYLFLLRYDVAFLKGDKRGVQLEAAAARGKSGAEDWISDHQAFARAYTGHLQEARRMSRRASDLAQQAAHRERAALFETRLALREAFTGTREPQNRRVWQHLRWPRTAKCSMAWPLPWLCREILRRLKHWQTIWKVASPRTPQLNSITCPPRVRKKRKRSTRS